MRPRTEAAIALALFGTAIVGVALLGRLRRPVVERDVRLSTLLTGPSGARGLSDGLSRVGVAVERRRDRQALFSLTGREGRRRALLMLSPPAGVSPLELASIANAVLAPDGMAIIASRVNGPAFASCFGYQEEVSVFDSLAVHEPGQRRWRRPAWVHVVMRYVAPGSAPAPPSVSFSEADPCLPVNSLTMETGFLHDTLLADDRGRPVIVRLHSGALRNDVILVSDPALFRNRVVRDTDAGPYLLSLLSNSFDHVYVDEYHQGFGSSGSLGRATLAWSLSSPWGWLVWQVAAAGVLALLVGAIRFGPVRSLPSTTRRSPQEHVRALATALAAARGHQVAVGELVLGLRRRLSPGGRTSRARWRPWLQQFTLQATNPETRAAAERLLALTSDTVEPGRVLLVAQAVEDVWTTMRR